MKIGRLVAGASVLTAIGLAFAPGMASAHTALATPSCDGVVISVSLYPEGVTTTIVIDDRTIVRDGGIDETIPWSSTSDHTWSVHVDGVAEGTDRDFGGTWEACVATTTTTTTAPTTTTTEPATTTTEPATTTTLPRAVTTTTTEPATTTTRPPAVTTTQPPAATTSTPPADPTTTAPGLPTTTALTEVTQVLQEATTTTAAVATTTTTTTTTVAGSGSGSSGQTGGSLPSTGSSPAPLVGGAAIALLAGGALWVTARRRSAS